MSLTILGLGGLLSDPAACILQEGRITSAVEQDKVAEIGRPGDFPDEAVNLALASARLEAKDIGCVAVALPFAASDETGQAQLALRSRFPHCQFVIVEHHHAHAASAFYLSPFENSAVLSVDRAGDYRSAVRFQVENGQLWPERELYYPDSLGDLFNRITELLGYEPRADEHKVQWLSTSGTPAYLDVFEHLLKTADDGWPQFDRSYFDADRLINGGFSARFFEECNIDSSKPLSNDERANLASSLQLVVSRAVAAIAGGAQNVCLAGGLALNSLLVRSLEEQFKGVFVQPVGGNAGTALGAALWAWHNHFGQRSRVPFDSLCLGPSYSHTEVKHVLENCKLRFRFLPTDADLIGQAVTSISDGRIVAWMQGRMEFGPRALGNRSILASPLNPYSTENLNVYIKHREKSRKFAASIPAELAGEYFDCGPNARFLATVGRVKPAHRETFRAALLGEDLIRVHTVEQASNPLYHRLLIAAGEKSGLPVLYNTSFNLFGHPLVAKPRDAVRSFFSSGIDALFAGNFFIEK